MIQGFDRKDKIDSLKLSSKKLELSSKALRLLNLNVCSTKHRFISVLLNSNNFILQQNADFLFGDIVVTYEKMQEVEFSFFTLPDSGAFLTHAPRRLSEAFALVYPFQKDVWPPLVITVAVVGPILYVMIVIPERLKRKRKRRQQLKPFHNIAYIREMGITRRMFLKYERPRRLKEDGLLSRCVWFTMHIFLRQCCVMESHHEI